MPATRTLADVDPAVRALLAGLRTALEALYGDRLVRLVLFGSHARGDAHAESDVDVLVVLRGEVHVYRECAAWEAWSRRLVSTMPSR